MTYFCIVTRNPETPYYDRLKILETQITLKVEWGDCDPARIVFYPNYFRWFDQSTHHLFEQAGCSMGNLMDQYGGILPIVDAQASFKAPSRYGERIEITSTVSEWHERTLKVLHRVRNSGILSVEGYEMRAWVIPDESHPKGIRSAPIPDALKSAFLIE